MNKNLPTLKQNTQATLSKAKSLIGVADKILAKNSQPLKLQEKKTAIVQKYNISDDPNRVIEFSDNIQAWIDRDTGLMWEVKTKDNINHEYVWSKTDIAEAFDPEYLTDNVKDALSYARKLNAQQHAGFDDWRVPTFEELRTILTYKKNNDLFITKPLSCTSELSYWSSSKNINDRDRPLCVSFNNGSFLKYIELSDTFSVRCVRGIQKYNIAYDPERVIEFSDNIQAWMDIVTRLMWEVKTEKNIEHTYVWSQEDVEEAIFPEELTDDVKDAFSYAEKLNAQKYAGFDDWRVPSIQELETIITKDEFDDYCIKLPLSENSNDEYWSNTADVNNTEYALRIKFYLTTLKSNGLNKVFNLPVRCVRG